MKRGKVTEEKKAQVLGRITATTDYAALAGCDLIVEAVFEDPKVKAEVTKNVLAAVGPDTIFATNTSTLPITDLAKASDKPDQFIGIHFFSPSTRWLLVEIIKGQGDRRPRRGQGARLRAPDPQDAHRGQRRALLLRQPLHPALRQRRRAAAEGGRGPALIENAAKLVGMPLGPLQLTDETSLDLGAKIARATKAAMGEAYDDGADDIDLRMVEQGRLGRKSNAGFYAYDDAGKRQGLWDGLADLAPVADPA
jgi:3-hydroxyacyl-CoA dehydrogenase/enoyl-CoA hydratase/3-hydroxybutyryl-CoA epimerase